MTGIVWCWLWMREEIDMVEWAQLLQRTIMIGAGDDELTKSPLRRAD